MDRTNAGRVILDNSCLAHLARPGQRDAFDRALAAADMRVWPSVVNLLEAYVTPRADTRHKLLGLVSEFVDGRYLLPWPPDLLKKRCEDLASGSTQSWIDGPSCEALLRDPDALAGSREVAKRMLAEIEKHHDDAWQALRRKAQFRLRREDGDPWQGLAVFLEGVWGQRELLEFASRSMWEWLNLPGDPPIERLMADEYWRMFYEIDGLAMYERAVSLEEPRRVHKMDLLQIPYLALWHKRVLVTMDGPLIRVARCMLHRRYPQARVARLDEIWDAA